jgi:hypothetical protein
LLLLQLVSPFLLTLFQQVQRCRIPWRQRLDTLAIISLILLELQPTPRLLMALATGVLTLRRRREQDVREN